MKHQSPYKQTGVPHSFPKERSAWNVRLEDESEQRHGTTEPRSTLARDDAAKRVVAARDSQVVLRRHPWAHYLRTQCALLSLREFPATNFFTATTLGSSPETILQRNTLALL